MVNEELDIHAIAARSRELAAQSQALLRKGQQLRATTALECDRFEKNVARCHEIMRQIDNQAAYLDSWLLKRERP